MVTEINDGGSIIDPGVYIRLISLHYAYRDKYHTDIDAANVTTFQ